MKLIKPWNNDHNAYCELCGKGGNLLLCDYCNLSFHPNCLVPPLQTIPEGNWACPECSIEFDKAKRKRQAKLETMNKRRRLLPESSLSGMSLTPNRAYLIKNRVRLHRESLHHKAVAEVAQNQHSPL